MKITEAYGLKIEYADVLRCPNLNELLQKVADGTGCSIDMFFLPLLTAICGLMGVSVAKTHKKKIHFEEPNIIWSCVAAEPGM